MSASQFYEKVSRKMWINGDDDFALTFMGTGTFIAGEGRVEAGGWIIGWEPRQNGSLNIVAGPVATTGRGVGLDVGIAGSLTLNDSPSAVSGASVNLNLAAGPGMAVGLPLQSLDDSSRGVDGSGRTHDPSFSFSGEAGAGGSLTMTQTTVVDWVTFWGL